MYNADQLDRFIKNTNANAYLVGECDNMPAGNEIDTHVSSSEKPGNTSNQPDNIQTIYALVQQNVQLLSLLNLQQQRPVSVTSSGNQTQIPNFNIMPANAIVKFNGKDGPSSATLCLQQLENTALLHHWTDPFTFQTTETHLVDAFKFWFNS